MFVNWLKLSNDIAAGGLEGNRVIALRMVKLSRGGPGAKKEAVKMVVEKAVAHAEAALSLASGKPIESVVGRYRSIVRANHRRLTRAR
jgi:hypothetical protein